MPLPEWLAPQEFVLAKFVKGIVGPFWDQLWKTYRTAMGKLMAYGAVWSFRAGMSIRPDMMRNTFFNLMDKYLASDAEWVQAVRAYFHYITGVDPGILAAPQAGVIAAEHIGEHFLSPMLNMILPGGWSGSPTGQGLTPEDGLDGAEKFLGMNMRFQMQSFMMDFVTDFYGVEGARSITNLPQNISWAYGIGWLSWLVMGVPFRIAISEPLERYFQLRFRMKDLSLSQIADFYWSDPNFRAEGLQRLKELGYPDDDIPRVLDKARRKLSKGEMLDLVRHADMKLGDVIDVFGSMGHDEETARTLGQLLYNERYWKLIQDIAKAAEGQYKKDTITQTDLEGYLGAAGHKTDEISLIVSRLELEKLDPPPAEPKETGLTRAMVGTLYKRGEKDQTWTKLKLAELNWDPEEVDDFLVYYKPKTELEETDKSLTASMIGGLYKRGWILQFDAETLWDEIGVRASHVPLYVKYYTRPWDVPADLPPLKLLSPESVLQMYRDGILELEIAVGMLVEGGLAEHDSRLYLALAGTEAEEAEAQRPTLTIWEIAGAIADGIMDFASGIARLVEAGYTPVAAENYLKLQVAYRVATNVSIACSAGTMTYSEALAEMVKWGWSPADAAIYLQQHWCKPEES